MPRQEFPAKKTLDTIPGPSGSRLSWGRAMAKDALGYMETLQKQYGDIIKVPWVFPTYQVSDPELIGKVLLGTEKTNQKSIAYRRLNLLLGQGLVTSGGELWKKQRRLSNPAFHTKVIEGLVPMMQAEAQSMVDQWEADLERNRDIDFSASMSKLTFQIIVRALFSTDLSQESNRINEALHEIQEYANYLFYAPVPLPLFIPTAKNRRAKQALRQMNEVVYRVIDEHRRHPDDYHDLLSIYLGARDEDTGQGMSDQLLRDEVITLMLAGHDTTATSLSMCFDLLSRHPKEQERVATEVRAALPPGKWQAEDVKKLSYTSGVFSEAMRLYPATWAIARELSEDLPIKNFVLPKGSTLLLAQYLTHRHPHYWDRPESFRPERFASETSEKHHPFAYFPFGGGQRTCIGSQLARLEAQIILATVLRRFEVSPLPGHVVRAVPRITLTFEPGVKLRLSPLA